MADTKYEERLNELAKKMARANISTFDKLPEVIQNLHIGQWKASARIGLEFGAECYKSGYSEWMYSDSLEDGLITNGLKPQN